MPRRKPKTPYNSQTHAWCRAEKYYPSEQLKKELNDYTLLTGEYKSELAVRLVKSFFAEKRKEGQYPHRITLLPQTSPGPGRKDKGTPHRPWV